MKYYRLFADDRIFNPISLHYEKPFTFQINGKEIHFSRLFHALTRGTVVKWFETSTLLSSDSFCLPLHCCSSSSVVRRTCMCNVYMQICMLACCMVLVLVTKLFLAPIFVEKKSVVFEHNTFRNSQLLSWFSSNWYMCECWCLLMMEELNLRPENVLSRNG